MSIVAALAWSAILLFAMNVVAGVLKYSGWTREGMRTMAGNREQVATPGPLAGRATRAAANMVENLVIFVAAAVAVLFAGKETGQAQMGAAIFFWARLVYWPVYLAGIPYLRTLLWVTSIAGIAMMLLALL